MFVLEVMHGLLSLVHLLSGMTASLVIVGLFSFRYSVYRNLTLRS